MKAPWSDIVVLFVTAHLALGCLNVPISTREARLVGAVALPVQVSQPNRTVPPNSATNSTANTVTHTAVVRPFGTLPLSFEANDGQTDPEVKYISRGPGYTLFLTDKEAVFSLRKPRQQSSPQKQHRVLAEPVEFSVLRMRLVGAEINPEVFGEEVLPGKSNYFIGNDPKKWRTNVPHFKKVKYDSVYPGIDLVYYGNQGKLEYDFIVAAGADPGVIQMAFAGADALHVDQHGSLVVRAGGTEVRLQSPIVYQEIAERREKIEARYVVKERIRQDHNDAAVQIAIDRPFTVGFQLAAYDTTKPLIIDPVLVYATYLGGSDGDYATDIAVDSAGNMYVAGQTGSTNFPVQNALQGKNSGGGDIFITKLNAAGNQRIYSTYLGGSGGEGTYSIALDAGGNVYVTGSTSSTNFPTMNPIQANHAGGGDDAFVFKLNSTGSALVYSTYLGGSGLEEQTAIAVDDSGNAYVTGGTESTNFPTTNALQSILAGGRDAFITKINALGSGLIYSTYLGGTGRDIGLGIALDASGNVYIAGGTGSSDFPTVNPIQANLAPGGSFGGPSADGFIAKINAAGTGLVYSTYLGGNSSDSANAIATDPLGNVYVTGTTRSSDFPTMNPIDAVLDGFNDLFATKINADGSAIIFSTYLGGSEEDSAIAIAVDAAGDVYIAGSSNSPDFPLVNPIQPKYPGSGLNIPFVLKLNAAGSAIVFSTFFGGSGDANEIARGLAVDGFGNIYLAGWTSSTNMPVVNPIQKNISGSFEPFDGFVAKISQAVNLGAALPTGEIGVAYKANLPISGGVAPYIITIVKGTLPAGLSIDDVTITGTPSPNAKGTSITVSVTDAQNDTVTKQIKINILKALTISGSLKNTRVGRSYRGGLKVKGGSAPIIWAITSGALPAGLSFNSATGAVAGTPTEIGIFPLTFQAADALGGVATQTLNLTVN